MMSSGLYQTCELTFFNPDPRYYDVRDVRYLFPRDAFLGDSLTEKDNVSYESLCAAQRKLKTNSFMCVCALDKHDTERINLACSHADGNRKSLIGVFLNETRTDSKRFAEDTIDMLIKTHGEVFPFSQRPVREVQYE